MFLTISKIEDFDSSLLKIDKKSYKNIDMHYIRYIKMKSISRYESIASLNPLHFSVSEVNRSIEEKNGNKYLVFCYTDDEKKEVSKKHTELWDWVKLRLRQ